MRSILVLLFATFVAGAVHAQTFRYEVYDADLIPPHIYKERRERVLASMSPQNIAIVFSADVRNRQNDVDYEYRQNSDMLYLTGVPGPGATLLLVPRGIRIGQRTFREVLFIKERNPSREVWQGVSMGPAEAMEHLRIDTALPVVAMSAIIDSLLPGTDTVHMATLPTRALNIPLVGRNVYTDVDMKKWMKERNASITIKNPMPVLARLREVKDTAELRLMQRAIDISIEGHYSLMRGARPGMKEYELEALMEYAFKRQGAEDVGYPSIVGSSYNACILHYTTNRRTTQRNDLVLADCGAEYHGYTADITRTIPLNGTFSKEQRLIYNVVLEAQDSGIAASRMGEPFRAPHAAAKSVIARRMMELGIIDSVEHVGMYFNHGTSHYLGLDVHDPGTSGPLKENSVITVEPGVYIPEGSPCDRKWWNIGVRIEDDILITKNGPVNMSEKLVRSADEIEAIVGKAP
ncbi:MAG TPA: aminopeptidase P N-terminal domain-containing protein [Candidatus Didemnitutus sp.]|nr:aminopeptidase P N-terminal domain-containing protein [Candidatus Didemnitutus sp.]